MRTIRWAVLVSAAILMMVGVVVGKIDTGSRKEDEDEELMVGHRHHHHGHHKHHHKHHNGDGHRGGGEEDEGNDDHYVVGQDFDFLMFVQIWPITGCLTWEDSSKYHACTIDGKCLNFQIRAAVLLHV